MANPKPYTLPTLAAGLYTTSRASQIPHGAAQDGSKNHWHYPSDVLATPPGYAKLTTTLPNEYAYKFDGLKHYMRGNTSGTGSLIKASTAAFAIQVVFRMDALPQDFIAPGGGGYFSMIVARTYGTSAAGSFGIANLSYGIGLATNTVAGAKDARVRFFYSDGITISGRTSTYTPILLGTYYVATISYSAGTWEFHVGTPGGAQTTVTDATGAVVGLQDLSAAALFFGGVPVTDSSSSMTPAFATVADQVQYHFTGVIQEFRVWDKALNAAAVTANSAAQITSPGSDANLLALYQLTGAATDSYFIAPTKGTAGGGSGQAPYLVIHPREATWRDTGHVLGNPTSGTYSIDFDGNAQGFEIPDSWRYRKLESDDNSEIPFPTYFGISMRTKPRTLRSRNTLFQWTHVPDDTYSNHELTQTTSTGTFATSDMSNLLLETLDTGAGAYRFRAVLFTQKEVVGETLTIDTAAAPDDIDTTLAEASCKPGSLVVTVTAGGTVVLTDDGLGNIAISSGAGSLTTGTINYLTGDIDITLGVDITAASCDYIAQKATSVVSTNNLAAGTQYTVTASVDRATSSASGEVLTISANNVVDTLVARNAIPGTLVVSVTKTGGAGVVTLADDSQGGFTITTGTGTITLATINYTTGAIFINLVENLDGAGANTISYSYYTRTIQIQEGSAAKQTQSCPGGYEVPNTPELQFDLEYATTRKYVMILGRAVDQVRQINVSPTIVDDVDKRWSFDRSYDGEIKQVVISTSEQEFDEESLHAIVRDLTLTRYNTLALGLPVTSCWPMEEGAGESIEDIGQLGNTINFEIDPEFVWGRSGITTTNKSPFKGVFDHRYRSATGEVRKVCAVSGGTIYEVNQTTGAVTPLTDGFRNDDQNIIQTMRYQDSTVLCAQSNLVGPFQLWKDQLYRLSIAPPEGPIPWGFDNQGDSDSGSRRGTRKYTFTYYSAHQNKRSAPGPFMEVTVRFKRADIIFGTDAEINQQFPVATSINKAPYDASPGAGIGFSAWYGRTTKKAANDPDWYETQPGSSGALTNPAPLKKINLKNDPFVHDNENVSAEEIEKMTDYANNRVYVRVMGDDRVQFRGAYPGSLGRLWLQDDFSTTATVSSGGLLDCGATSTGTVFSGTGQTNHGLALPFSTDPQVTHLEIWRTVAGGNEYFLLARIPNGTKTYTDSTRDAELGGQPTLDLNQGEVPPTRNVIDFAGRAFYYGDDLAPFRLYISQPGQPWNVPPQNTIDLLDGSTLSITGAARTENTLVVFKNDTTFVITSTGNPDFPFNIETRHRDVGCVAPFGIVNVREIFHYPDEQGFFRFDTNTLEPISGNIDATWSAIPPAHYEKIVGIHDRPNSAIIWFCPTGNTTISGTVVNDQALVYFYETGAWSLLTGIYASYAAIVPDANEVNRVWLIDSLGYISTWDSGTNFGVGTATSRTPALAAGTFSTTQVTVAQATLAAFPDGYKGLPITVVKVSTGARETRVCTADTLASPSVLTLDRALSFTPANTSDFLVYVGSIEADWISGEMLLAGPSQVVQLTDIHVQATPQATAANYSIKWQASGGVIPGAVSEGTATVANARSEKLIAADNGSRHGRRTRVRVQALGPDMPFEIRFLTLFHGSDSGRSAGEYRGDE